MRRIAVLILVAAAASFAAVAGAATPVLRVTTVDPLRVAGSHFKARERVTVTAVFGANRAHKQVTATRTGTFTVTFDSTSGLDPCSADGFVRVIRKGGAVLSVKVLSERMCPAP